MVESRARVSRTCVPCEIRQNCFFSIISQTLIFIITYNSSKWNCLRHASPDHSYLAILVNFNCLIMPPPAVAE